MSVPPDSPAEGGPAVLGQPCTTGAGCASGNCVHGVCCNTDCRDRCRSCTLASALGTCALVPAGEDPHNDCEQEAVTTCGRSGACNGAGACAQHAAGTECRARTCAAAVETPANLCDGAGTCLPATARACAPLDCTGDRCAVGCSVSAPCPSGFDCVASRCVGTGATLHWRFDETSGSTAQDASGNGYAGMYVGEPNVPQPSTSVPPTSFANLRSRSFPDTGRPGVYRGGLAARLTPSNGMTLSIWFRATSAPRNGVELVNINEDVMLRLAPIEIEFDKRRSTTPGAIFTICRAEVTGHLDGRWHHVAGVMSTRGMDLYVDGVLRDHENNGDSILFRSNPSLWVGREAADPQNDFSGELDDFRIYTRALDASEVAALARGGP